MEASEAMRRIFWRNRWLLLLLVIVPAALVTVMLEHRPVMYVATSAVQGQSTTPDADTQVSAIQSRVTAVAKDPAVVQQAITAAHVNRDATQVAQHDISVSPLGSSAVMTLAVTDRSRAVALRLSGTLATAVVSQLNQLGVKDNPELAGVSSSISQLTAKRDKLVSELAAASAAPVTTVNAQSLLAQLSATEQQLASEESTSQQILSALSANGASVVSTPSSATQASRHAAADAALAALLGLVLGLLFGALREIIRPTVAQPTAGARELGVIPLGNAGISRGQVTDADDDLAGRFGLAAHRAGARTIVLTGPCSHATLTALAGRLNGELAATAGNGAQPRMSMFAIGDGESLVELDSAEVTHRTVVAMPDIRLGDPPADAALVVVLPAFAQRSALDRAADLGVAAGWPILGVIGLRRGQRVIGRPAPREALHTEPAMERIDD